MAGSPIVPKKELDARSQRTHLSSEDSVLLPEDLVLLLGKIDRRDSADDDHNRVDEVGCTHTENPMAACHQG